jgi:hypothetical protein
LQGSSKFGAKEAPTELVCYAVAATVLIHWAVTIAAAQHFIGRASVAARPGKGRMPGGSML